MWILIIIAVIIIIVLIAKALPRGAGGREKYPYYRKKYLLTEAESSFFRVLEQATENKYYIFPQIRISNLLYVKGNKNDLFRYQSKIKYKSVDFVLTNKNYLNPLLAIELDDSSHNYNKRIKRDNFVKNAFEDAGLPLLRIRCSRSYDINNLKNQIEEMISGKKETK